MSELITADLVRLDASLGSDKNEVIRALAAVVAEAGRTGNPDGLAEDALAREATSSTGLPGGIAIPHCRTEHVDVPTLAFARLSPAPTSAPRTARRTSRSSSPPPPAATPPTSSCSPSWPGPW